MMTLAELLLTLALCTALVSCQSPESRLAILQGTDGDGFHAFRTDEGVLYQMLGEGGPWIASPSIGSKVVTNPVSVHLDHFGVVFVMGSDGQVYYGTDMGDGIARWTKLTTSPEFTLPHDVNATADVNAFAVVRNNDTVHVFVKSLEKESRLYWTHANASTTDLKWSQWQLINKGAPLQSAPSAAVNHFTKYVEVAAVMADGKVYHTWQTSHTSFHDWDDFSSLFWSHFPDPRATPVLRSNSGESIFNGRLELFLYGKDGVIHHLAQTTCDKVMNPWSECTWGLYERLEKHAVPAPLSEHSPLVGGANAHGGIELFTVSKTYHFWHLYQIEQGKDYHTWVEIPCDRVYSSPTIYQDLSGYWVGYFLDTSLKVHRVVQNRTMGLQPASGPVNSGSNITVTWSVPVDEATNADWIGVYKHGDSDDKYLDFGYVQGGQNPLHDPVPVGSIVRRSVLGNGQYDYRYLVNRKFVSIMQRTIAFDHYTNTSEGTQLYHGLAVGLGKEAGHFDTCFQDGNHTVAVFRQAFIDFENRDIVAGLQLLGTGLKDLQAALVACEETDIAKQVEKFIKDLIACTHENCVKFVIDVVGELISVFYENVHEIYGDIHGAKNCFPYQLYEQAGINIGRVVAAAIEGPRV